MTDQENMNYIANLVISKHTKDIIDFTVSMYMFIL